jgi:hypothetical protein
MILIMNIPFFLQLFQFAKIGTTDTLICIAAGLLTITWFEVYKAINLKHNCPSPTGAVKKS